MDTVQQQPVQNIPIHQNVPAQHKETYSFSSIIIAILLGITLTVALQFFTTDMILTIYGERPSAYGKISNVELAESRGYKYKGKLYDDYSEATKDYNEIELLPYEGKALSVRAFVVIPLFLLSVILAYTVGKKKSSYKIATRTFFLAISFNTLILLISLAGYIYTVNQRFAIYGISFVLIIMFILSIIYIQDRKEHKSLS